jgi:hypothetical protein
MSSLNPRVVGGGLTAVLVLALTVVVPARAHHSFAAYNMDVTKVFTGVVTRVNPDANHLQIFFAPMNEERKNVLRDGEGKPVIWAVEMGGSAQMAREGVTVASFPPGTIFSVGLHPLRDGQPAGTRGPNGAMFKCPERKPPPAGQHCDVVEGSTAIGKGGLLKPTE